jgi:hypothetical protein
MRYWGKLQDKNNTFYCPITYGYSGAYPNYRWYYLPGAGFFLYQSVSFRKQFKTEDEMFKWLDKQHDAR